MTIIDRRRRRLAALTLAIGLTVAPVATLRAEDAGPSISVGSTASAAASRTYGNVTIAWPGESGAKLTIGKVVVEGSAGDKGFDARQITINDLKLGSGSGPADFVIDSAVLKDAAGPALSPDVLAATLTPGKLPPIVGWLLAIKAKSIDIPSWRFNTSSHGETSELTLETLHLDDVDAGKIAALAIASMAETNGTGASTGFSGGKVAMEDVDLGAYALWLDDAAAAAASPEKRLVYGKLAFADLHFLDKQTTIAIDRLEADSIKLGRPAIKPSELAKIIGKMSADPKFADNHPGEFVPFLRSAIEAYEIGAIELAGWHSKPADDPAVDLGLLRLEDFGAGKLGEFRVGDLAVDDPRDGTTMKLGSFSMRGIEVVDLDAFFERMANGESTDNLAVADYPKAHMDALALADLTFVMPAKGELHIKAWTLDTPEWGKLLPTSLKSRLEGFSMPVASLKDAEAEAGFKSLGLKDVRIDSRAEIVWSEADGTLTFGPGSTTIAGIGSIEMGATLGGVPKVVFDDPEQATAALATLDFRAAHVALKDGGGFELILANAEREKGASRGELAAVAVAAIRQGGLAKIASAQTVETVAAAAKAFILDPRSIRFAVTALQPVPVMALSGLDQDEAAQAALKQNLRIEAKANE